LLTPQIPREHLVDFGGNDIKLTCLEKILGAVIRENRERPTKPFSKIRRLPKLWMQPETGNALEQFEDALGPGTQGIFIQCLRRDSSSLRDGCRLDGKQSPYFSGIQLPSGVIAKVVFDSIHIGNSVEHKATLRGS
jgi:hypothetical protein